MIRHVLDKFGHPLSADDDRYEVVGVGRAADVDTKLVELGGVCNAAINGVRAHDIKLRALNAECKTLKTSLESVGAELSARLDGFSDFGTKLSGFDGKLLALEARLAAVEARITSASSDLVVTNTKLAAIDTEIKRVDAFYLSQMRVAAGKLYDHDSLLDSLKIDCSALKDKVESTVGLSGRLGSVESGVAGLTSKLDSTIADLHSVDLRCGTVENNAVSLKTELEARFNEALDEIRAAMDEKWFERSST